VERPIVGFTKQIPDRNDRAPGLSEFFVAHLFQFPENHAGNISSGPARNQYRRAKSFQILKARTT